MRSIAQNRFTAVGLVAARVRQISSNSSSSRDGSAWRTPSATPIAAATPMAGAPRITIVRMASATSR
jgi:hypothetical protein